MVKNLVACVDGFVETALNKFVTLFTSIQKQIFLIKQPILSITIHFYCTLILQNFGFDGKLVVNYACSMAWG